MGWIKTSGVIYIPIVFCPLTDWAGAVMQKPLGIQKCDGRTGIPTDIPTDLPTDTASRVACPREKTWPLTL